MAGIIHLQIQMRTWNDHHLLLLFTRSSCEVRSYYGLELKVAAESLEG